MLRASKPSKRTSLFYVTDLCGEAPMWTQNNSLPSSLADADLYSEADDDIYAELEDSLEELEDGLDVLMILERAYEKALRSHVCPADQDSSPGTSRSLSPSDSHPEHVSAASSSSTSPTPHSSTSIPEVTPGFVPLFEGSSTALVAILEHPSSRPPKSSTPWPARSVSCVGADGESCRGCQLRMDWVVLRGLLAGTLTTRTRSQVGFRGSPLETQVSMLRK